MKAITWITDEYYEEYIKKLKEQTDRRGDLLRAAYEFIDGMTLQEAELRMAIEKELADAEKES